jgi:hypothetical protein
VLQQDRPKVFLGASQARLHNLRTYAELHGNSPRRQLVEVAQHDDLTLERPQRLHGGEQQLLALQPSDRLVRRGCCRSRFDRALALTATTTPIASTEIERGAFHDGA